MRKKTGFPKDLNQTFWVDPELPGPEEGWESGHQSDVSRTTEETIAHSLGEEVIGSLKQEVNKWIDREINGDVEVFVHKFVKKPLRENPPHDRCIQGLTIEIKRRARPSTRADQTKGRRTQGTKRKRGLGGTQESWQSNKTKVIQHGIGGSNGGSVLLAEGMGPIDSERES